MTHFLQVYLASFCATATCGVGALFFIMVSHVGGARWFVLFRRPAEAVAGLLPLLPVLFVPLAFGMSRGMVARAYAYMVVWIALGESLRRASLRMDAADEPARRAAKNREKTLSALGIPLLFFTLTFAAFDWIMSINAGFSDDMLGLSVGTSAGCGAMAAIILCALLTSRRAPQIRPDHVHALGQMLHLTVCLWAYIMVCQLVLIWITDLPHEVSFLVERQRAPWRIITLVLPTIHFGVPFLLLLSRALKRNARALEWVAALVLCAHLLDMYWLVVPAGHGDTHWSDLVSMVLVPAVALIACLLRLRAAPRVPALDPDLPLALEYESP